MAHSYPGDHPALDAEAMERETYAEWGRRIDQLTEDRNRSDHRRLSWGPDNYNSGHPSDACNTVFDYDTPHRPIPAQPHGQQPPVGTPALLSFRQGSSPTRLLTPQSRSQGSSPVRPLTPLQHSHRPSTVRPLAAAMSTIGTRATQSKPFIT